MDFAASPGVDGEAVAGQRLRGGSGVHVAGVGPSGRGGFGGVMLLHGRHGGPGTGALGPPCTSFLLIGTEKVNTTLPVNITHRTSACLCVCVFVGGSVVNNVVS